MTLNSSGAISIGGSTSGQSINLELGRSATATSSLGESALRSLAGVASGAISLSNFYGKSNASLAATLQSYNTTAYEIDISRDRIVPSGSVYATVGITLNSDGSARYFYEDIYTATASFTEFTWKTGGGSAGDYFARFIVDIGSSAPNNFSSAIGTNLALNGQREWRCYAECTTNQENFYGVTGTLQIRDASNTILASRTLSMFTSVVSGTPL